MSRLWLILGVLLGAVMLGAVGRRVDVGQVGGEPVADDVDAPRGRVGA